MIKDFLIAIGNFKKYGELTERKVGRIVGYCILLLLVCSIGIIVVPTFTMGAKTLSVIWEDIPEFTLTPQGLEIKDDFDLELYGVKALVTNKHQVSESDFGNDVIAGVLMDEDSFIIRNFAQTAEFSYSEMGKDFVVEKNDLIALKPALILSGVMVCALLFISLIISFVLNGLFIGAFSGVVSIFMKVRVPTGALIKLGMYSQTLPVVVSGVLGFFGVIGESRLLYVIYFLFVALWLKSSQEPDYGTEN